MSTVSLIVKVLAVLLNADMTNSPLEDWQLADAARLKRLCKTAGLTQDEIADALDVNQSSVSQFLNGRIPLNIERLIDFSNLLEIPPEQISPTLAPKTRAYTSAEIDHPDNVTKLTQVKLTDKSNLQNVSLGPQLEQGGIPLISWVKAGEAEFAVDLLQPGDAERMLPPPPKKYSNHTYALRVKGDSMTAPYGKSYPNGSLIYVDPEQRGGAGPGDRIIARINGQDKVTFKQLAEDGGRTFLKPLNPQYPPLFEKFEVLGKVIGKWEDD